MKVLQRILRPLHIAKPPLSVPGRHSSDSVGSYDLAPMPLSSCRSPGRLWQRYAPAFVAVGPVETTVSTASLDGPMMLAGAAILGGVIGLVLIARRLARVSHARAVAEFQTPPLQPDAESTAPDDEDPLVEALRRDPNPPDVIALIDSDSLPTEAGAMVINVKAMLKPMLRHTRRRGLHVAGKPALTFLNFSLIDFGGDKDVVLLQIGRSATVDTLIQSFHRQFGSDAVRLVVLHLNDPSLGDPHAVIAWIPYERRVTVIDYGTAKSGTQLGQLRCLHGEGSDCILHPDDRFIGVRVGDYGFRFRVPPRSGA